MQADKFLVQLSVLNNWIQRAGERCGNLKMIFRTVPDTESLDAVRLARFVLGNWLPQFRIQLD